MTKEQCFDSLRLIRNQLDELDIQKDDIDETELDNAYLLINSIWQHIKENVE